ncbi:hypothetical protein KC660_01010 [Candidatus Dojkabacteria bacterium]|uniref:Uncharacterized protein n=1 Tax=Candidatus Dojkabacteria bacterium TaxID=2099670 RepID=A0A955L2Z7_9BACT|nr:hypothetical protein [Candidatus Dojkabacteria bacterium]
MNQRPKINKILVLTLGIFVTGVIALSLFATHTNAQSPLIIEATKGLQSGKNEQIPVKIKIRSSIASDRFELNINAPSELKAVYQPHVFTSIEADKDYEIVYDFKPTKEGVYNVVVEGQLWQADTNYKSNDIVTFTINKDLQLEPVSEQYLSEKKQKKILGLVKTFLIIVVVLAVGTFLTKLFIEWLNKD